METTKLIRTNLSAASVAAIDYSLKLSDFLKEIKPGFELPESLAFLKEQTIYTLNLLLKLVQDLYSVSKENFVDIGTAFIHVINFYIGTKNSTSWTDISIGFASLCLSLFKLDSVKSASKHIHHVVSVFFRDLKKYFIHSESAEKTIKSFWSDLNVTNPRTLFGIVHACSGVLTSVLCLKSFVDKSFSDGDITKLITELSNGIFKIGSEVRQHAENISYFLARIYDWIFVNAEALMKLQFDKIKWELPADQVFESKFVELSGIMNSYLDDPLYLEVHNLTLQLLRDRLNKLREKGETELNKNPTPSIRQALARYLSTIDGYIRTVETRLNPDNTKPQPMAVTLVGSAGCGKSSASTKIGLMMQAIAKRVPDESLINNRGGDPKFEENITSSTDVIISDDFANDQSRTLQTKDVLDIVNTSKEVIPKANADQKGKHKFCNIGTLFTTNDVNLGIRCFKTASKDSLLRRMGYVIHLGIAEPFRREGTDMLDLNHPSVSDENFNTDVYEVKIMRPLKVSTDTYGTDSVDYEDIPFDRHEGNNEWRDAILQLQKLLDNQWSKNVERHAKSKSNDNNCCTCKLPFDVCICNLHAESLNFSRERFSTLFYMQPKASALQMFYSLDTCMLDFSSKLAAKLSLYIFYKNISFYFLERARLYWDNCWCLAILFIISNFVLFGPLLLVSSIIFYEWWHVRTERHRQFERNLRNGTFIANSYKLRYSVYGITFLAGALTLTTLFSSLSVMSTVVLKSENAIIDDSPTETSPKEVDEELIVDFSPSKEKTNSDTIGHYITRPRPAHQARTMTREQMLNEVGKGISSVSITNSDGVVNQVKCLPFGSERLIPSHALPSKGVMDIFVEPSHNKCSGYKNVDLPQTHVSILKKQGLLKTKELDAALVHLPNAPPVKDFHKYLAEEGTIPASAACNYIHKDRITGEFSIIPVRARLLHKPVRYTTAQGYQIQQVYECEALNHCSSEGDCGQPLICNNSIIGIHIAGTGSNVFYCLAIDKSTVSRANDILKQESSVFVASHPSEPIFKNNLKELSIIDESTSYVNDSLGVDTTPILSLGIVVDASNSLYRPRAEDYYFRNGNTQIEAEFGELSSRPPKFCNGAEQINTTLMKFNEPKTDVPISLMDRAVNDYLYGLTDDGRSVSGIAANFEKESPGFFSVRSLNQALDGDQTGIIRGMNNQTSSGICYGGKKTKYLKLDPLTSEPIVPRQLDSIVENDILKLEHSWRSGQGTFDPFVRASKTNEVLPLEKARTKTRSVYGNDMAFFIAATRAIIPLKHVLREKDVSECYVGVAAQSTEWSELHQYLSKGGDNTKFVCGDFSGYDTQLPKALLEKSAAIILQIYRENGASSSDIEYLRGFLSSVVSPAMIWEGHLLQFCSGQPSGQPLTVEMNSIVNSILCRMAFFTIMDEKYPEIKNPNFRSFVRLADYGDDNAMGVDDSIPEFNHTAIQAVFASWGIKYTMADKDADSVPFQTIDEVSFLKRSFRYHPQLDAVVAPLEVESLSKKFYWWTKSKNTPLNFPEQFQANFDSQAREAYLHGEEFYEEFCAKCERIIHASQSGDERFCLPWNTIQPVSSVRMRSMLIDAYHSPSEDLM